MSGRLRRSRTFNSLLVAGIAIAFSTAASSERRSTHSRPLRVTAERTVDDAQPFSLISGPCRCDAAGNIFFVPVAHQGSGGVATPDTVVEISGTGRKSTRFSLGSVEHLSGARIVTTALDGGGDLYVLARSQSEKGAKQSVVSFDSQGKYRSKIDVDIEEIVVDNFAAFGAGAFLLAGERPHSPGGARRAVLAADGTLRDVWLPESGANRENTVDTGEMFTSFAEVGPDGRIYFARNTDKSDVYSISSSGEIDKLFDLVPPRRNARLTAIKISRNRLAAIYQIDVPETGTSSREVSIHDLSTGETLASYGPIPNLVMCYQSTEALPDRFTLFSIKNWRMQLLTALP